MNRVECELLVVAQERTVALYRRQRIEVFIVSADETKDKHNSVRALQMWWYALYSFRQCSRSWVR